jgi:glycosyltransferase involved in cell wall biosynthesis
MGAVNFSLSPELVASLKDALPLEVLVETGTFRGDSIAGLADRFEAVYSVEMSEEYYSQARERLAGLAHVHLTLGHSPDFLADLRPGLAGRSVLYFLDAHWCVASDVAGNESQCPLLDEIAAIGRLEESSVILIDDARLFLAPPPEPHEVSHWPSFDQVDSALRKLSAVHELMVVNDVIVFHPASARAVVNAFARSHGLDWLRAAQSIVELAESVRDREALRASLDERLALISEQDAALEKRVEVIRRQDDELRAAERAHIEVTRMAQDTERTLQDVVQMARNTERALEIASEEIEKTALSLKEKEAVIRELDHAVKAYRAAPVSVFGRTIRPIGWGVNLFRRFIIPFFTPARLRRYIVPVVTPKLGVLHQHAPRALRVPARPASLPPPAGALRISLVTPSFGQADFIERTIRSVLEQGYPNLEYYVQDGGSIDGTGAILERYADRLSGWDARPDSGQSQAINRGFARTTGEIMAWLNSDDVLLPGTLAYVADYFARHPEVDVVYGHRVLLDEGDRQIGVWILPGHDDDVLSWADFVPQETMFWRRRIWERAGGRIDESFQFAMDWDLLVRFRDAGARFARLPRFLAGFRVHAQQKTSAAITDVGFREMNLIRERELGRVPSKGEIRKALRSYMVKHLLADFTWRVQDKLGFRS